MKKFFVLLLSLSVFFTACEEEVETPQPVNTLVAHAGDDQQANVGQLVTLDGSKSKDSENKPFMFEWTVKAKPQNSNVTLTEANTVSPKFAPDKDGTYQFELKITRNEFHAKDEVSIVVTTPAPVTETVVLNQNIDQDRQLSNIFDDPNTPDYIVTNDIHVKGFLTIDPKVVIAFEEGVAMYIDNPGAIRAEGWGGNEIVFTGKIKTKGFWKGLIINSNHSLNLLEHVIIEYGGSSNAYGLDVPTNLGLDNSGHGSISLRNSKIRNSAGYGMVVDEGATLRNDMFNNSYQGNKTPMKISASQIMFIDGFSTFYDNENNLIEVVGNTVHSNMQEVVWGSGYTNTTPPTRIPFLVKGKIEVTSGLRILNGTTFVMEKDAEIMVVQNGYLNAQGTQGAPIKFSGKEQSQNGYWKGIGFKTASTSNQLKHVEVSDAGSDLIYGFEKKSAIAVDGDTNGKIRITDSKITRSGNYGLFVESNADLVELNFMHFENNKGSAVALSARHVKSLFDPVMGFAENGHNGIEVYESILNEGNVETIFPNLNFNSTYLISGDLDVRSGLKIMPGSVLQFAEGKMIKVSGNGYLSAQGSENNLITFRGAEQSKGYWNGILFQTNSNLNFLNFTQILHAGKTAMVGINKITSIGIDGDYYSKAIVANSKIAHGNGYGIVVESNNASINDDVEQVNLFQDLVLGHILK